MVKKMDEKKPKIEIFYFFMGEIDG